MVSGTMLAGVRVPSDAFFLYIGMRFAGRAVRFIAFLQVNAGKLFLFLEDDDEGKEICSRRGCGRCKN